MTEKIEVHKIDEVYMRVFAEPSTLQELTEFFSFRPQGYQFSPKFKSRVWDGYVRLMTPFKPYLYVGLLSQLKQFCDMREYDLIVDDELEEKEDIPEDYGYQLSKKVGSSLTLRDYQNDYVVNAIRNKRTLSLSPTSSGKSYMQYLLFRHYHDTYQHRVLIIVPTVSLVHQMAGDFIEYGCNPDIIYKIQGGIDKDTDGAVTITTWQSIQKQSKEWFEQFKVIIGDEAHLFTGKSLSGIMEKCVSAPYKFGFTGTISSDSKTHRLVLQGLFGEIKKFISTKNLIDRGDVATFNIKCLVLNHPKEVKKVFRANIKKIEKQKKYPAEREFIVNNRRRNLFIKRLIDSLDGQNNLILFELVEKHGKLLEPMLQKEDRVLHFVTGSTSGEKREEIRHIIENDKVKRHNILASYGVFSTGISIKRIDNIILASGSKSEIRILQSIGRSLRKGNGSDDATLYDITDNLSEGSFENYTLSHFKTRLEIYSNEQFPFRIFNIDLNE